MLGTTKTPYISVPQAGVYDHSLQQQSSHARLTTGATPRRTSRERAPHFRIPWAERGYIGIHHISEERRGQGRSLLETPAAQIKASDERSDEAALDLEGTAVAVPFLVQERASHLRFPWAERGYVGIHHTSAKSVDETGTGTGFVRDASQCCDITQRASSARTLASYSPGVFCARSSKAATDHTRTHVSSKPARHDRTSARADVL
ncbi:hypothetical protein FOMPIDRAFT_1056539 [Fomitopsis schrenkii]|uniref:Uncharacterized protein n=1 Tax=Fomitopsis schrenkii TaxID=2126942 RepID=S8DIZ3_FOMSC|nr:hypothetical protein FOMPIDRAFT_1056539 [Fomitopsis schrenkii]